MAEETQNYEFELKLKGDNEISAKSLCGVLENLILVAENTIPDGASQINYMVKATAKGSFAIVFNAIATLSQQLTIGNGEIINLAKNSIQTISEILKLRKFLKGEKPKKIEDKGNGVNVTNNYGTINYFNVPQEYINNKNIDKGMIGLANALSGGNYPGMVITDKEMNEEIITVPKEDYEYIKQPLANEDTEKIYENEYRIDFTVKKADLQGNSKWDIILDKKCVSVTIEDTEWLKKVQSGMISVNSKKILKGKIKVTQRGNKYGMPIEGTEKYYLMKVYDNDRESYLQYDIDE